MFKWLRGTDDGLADVEERFTGMLSDGRHVFDLAMSARLGGADPDSIADTLLKTEERTDEAEREIRRRVIVHASVHGTADLAKVDLRAHCVNRHIRRVEDQPVGVRSPPEAPRYPLRLADPLPDVLRVRGPSPTRVDHCRFQVQRPLERQRPSVATTQWFSEHPLHPADLTQAYVISAMMNQVVTAVMAHHCG
jgi:hypothetical protein